MLVNTQDLENILTQVKQLSPENRIRLIQRITETLIDPAAPPQPQPIQFGEYKGDEPAMSTLEDFKIAEWWPTDEDLNGF